MVYFFLVNYYNKLTVIPTVDTFYALGVYTLLYSLLFDGILILIPTHLVVFLIVAAVGAMPEARPPLAEGTALPGS